MPSPLAAVHPDGAKDLAAVLLASPRLGVILIADDDAQEIRPDRLPRLGRFDRAQLMQRRMEQHFSGALAACIAVKRDAEGETAYFAYLPETSPSYAWLRWLAALPNPRRGTILSGDIIACMARDLAGKDIAAWMHIFIAMPGGARQVTLHDGQPVLTRMIAMDDDGEQPGEAIQQALRDARNYLARHGWRFDAEEEIVAVAPKAALADAAPGLPADALLLSPQDAAAWLKLPYGCADGVGLLIAAQKHFRRRLHPLWSPEAAAANRENIIARGGWAVAATILLACVLTAGSAAYDLYETRRLTEAQKTEQTEIQAAIDHVEQSMGGDVMARTRMRHAQMLRDAASAPAPWVLLSKLGDILPPAIRLRELTWQAQPGHGALTGMTMRLALEATEKDPAQKEALQLYRDFADAARKAMPAAEIKETQAPYALDSAHPFSDPAMLSAQAAAPSTATLEIREP